MPYLHLVDSYAGSHTRLYERETCKIFKCVYDKLVSTVVTWDLTAVALPPTILVSPFSRPQVQTLAKHTRMFFNCSRLLIGWEKWAGRVLFGHLKTVTSSDLMSGVLDHGLNGF
jgi:hypothetical protein